VLKVFLVAGAVLLAGSTSLSGRGNRLSPEAMDVTACQPLAIIHQDQAATVNIPLVGTRASLVYRSDRVPGRKAAPAADVRGQGLGGFTIDVHHSYDPSTKVLLQGDGARRLLGAEASRDELVVASTDGQQVFAFDKKGRHSRTVDAMTGAVLWSFEHDPSGRLSALEDRAGQKTRFAHDSSDHLTAVTLPSGATLQLETDRDGYLTSLQHADGRQSFTYGAGGLLAAQAASGFGETTYQYDEGGLLTAYVERAGTTSFKRRTVAGGTRSMWRHQEGGRSVTSQPARLTDST